jgi:hypothetical protein
LQTIEKLKVTNYGCKYFVAATWKPKLEGHHTEYTGILSALYVKN